MTTSSARPDHLRRYAADTFASVAGARRATDTAAVAATHVATSGGDAGLATPAVWAARAAIDRLALLAGATRSIGDAFAAADAGTVGGLVTAADVGLSRSLTAHAAGIADDELLGPMRFAAGADFAQALDGLSLGERLERLQDAAEEEGYGPAFAAGVIRTLGADGLTDLTEQARTAYAHGHLGLTTADRGLAALGALFQDAARTVIPVADPAALAASLATTSSGRTPYALDLGVLRQLGRRAAGRNTLRQLVLDAPDLSTPIVVTIAAAIARPHGVAADRPADEGSFRLLEDRQVRRWDVAAPELPMLVILARDPLAAWAWDEARPGGASPLAAYLPHRGRAETNELARIADSVLLESVRQGWSGAYAAPLVGAGAAGVHPPAPASLREVVDAAGQARPTPRLTRTLATVVATHGEAFRELAATEAYRGTDDHTLTDYFRVVAADRDALATVTANALGRYHLEAVRVLAAHPPVRLDVTDLTSGLADSHGVLLAVERGAVEAGKHHNAAIGFAVTATAVGSTAGLKYGSKTGHPIGVVAGMVGPPAVDAGARLATDRWVDRQDGRSARGAEATAHAEPYLLAVAMTGDPAWGAVVVDPAALDALDLVRSTADRRTFARWLAQQPPVVRQPILAILTSAP